MTPIPCRGHEGLDFLDDPASPPIGNRDIARPPQAAATGYALGVSDMLAVFRHQAAQHVPRLVGYPAERQVIDIVPEPLDALLRCVHTTAQPPMLFVENHRLGLRESGAIAFHEMR